MNPRTLIAIVLCCLVWFVYMQWFAPIPAPRSSSTNQEKEKITSKNEGIGRGNESGNPILDERILRGGVDFGKNDSTSQYSPVVSFQVNRSGLELGFSEYGGNLVEVGIQDYRESVALRSPVVKPLQGNTTRGSLGVYFSEEQLREFTNAKYTKKEEKDKVEFFAKNKEVELYRSYDFRLPKYYIGSTIRFYFPKGIQRRDWGTINIPIRTSDLKFDANNPIHSWEFVFYQNEKLTRVLSESVDKEETYTGNTGWIAFGNRFFSIGIIPTPFSFELAEQKEKISGQKFGSGINPDVILGKKDTMYYFYLRYPIRLKEGQTEWAVHQKIFVGPKEPKSLENTTGLKELIDYGIFSWLAYPILEVLRFFYKFTKNYGIAIILLTILVRLLFYPLSLKAAQSSKRMQELQPELAKLKEKYKDNLQKFNQEQMALMKTRGVNPLGGCLPLLLQLPVFIALYAVLGNSIELFHSPFFGWIQDLSAKDPYYVFPVLMGIAMVVQQKMTPPAPNLDPTQAKILLFMPVLFSFFMLNLPAGLTLYMFLSTILGIIQQVLVNSKSPSQLPVLG